MRQLSIVVLLVASCAAPKSTPAPNMAAPGGAKAEPKGEAKETPKPAEAPMMQPMLDPQIASAAINLGKAEVKGSLSSADITAALERAMPGLEFCYTEARQSNPTLAGKMKLVFVIGQDGSANEVDVKESVSPALDQCIEKKVSQLKFPPSEQKTEVGYPLVFVVK